MQRNEVISLLLSEGAVWEWQLGSKDSGHHGHKGIPGQRGGSLPRGARSLPQPWRDGSYGDIAELVPIDIIEQYQEHHWTRRYHPRMTQKEYDALSDDIAKNGFKDPLIMDYNPTNGYTVVIEGNHRLAIARDLGLKYVPVRLVRGKYVNERTGTKVENSKLITDEYVPGNISPSMVFNLEEFQVSDVVSSDGHIHVLGSDRSGNYGHKGRPGRRGGSAAGTGLLTVPQDFDSVLNEISYWEGTRQEFAHRAVMGAKRQGWELVTLREEGELVGVAALSKGSLALSLGDTYKEVEYFATKRRGFGYKTLRALSRKLAKQGGGLCLFATDGATSFYKAIGMRLVESVRGGHPFHWTPQDLKDMQ